MLTSRAVVLLVGLVAGWGCARADEEFMVCDFDAVEKAWRSKFSAHEVVELERDGQKTRALRLTFDLSRAPHYDWFRAMVDDGMDVRPYRYLSFSIRADGNGAKLIPMLMQRTEPTEQRPTGELVAAASDHPVVLSFSDWRRFSVPLSAFQGLDALANRIDMVNFSLVPAGGRAGPAELFMDEVMLATQPRGEVVEETVPFPPADIAVKNEEDFFGLLDLTRRELRDLRAAVEARDWEEAKRAWARHLETRTEPRWTWSRRDRERIAALYDERWGGLKRFVPAADRVLARDFDFLGVRKTLDRDIQWLQGPWEWTHVLSRFAYWQHLGYAYWATGDSKYAEDFVYTLRDWVADNPVPRILTNSRGTDGTVWRTLETGIRGDLWFDVMELFMDAPEFDAQAKYEMTRSLVEHARHLHRYTIAFRHGNWQVVECTGLAAIGIMLPELREAAAWRERAFDYLVQHMEKDVYPDGAHYELTPGYHGWVMERFLKAALLCRTNGYDVPRLLDRHEKMFEFLMHISKPDRRFPSLGDAGSGGSIVANMGLGALLYGRGDMRYLGPDDISAGWVWMFGPDVTERYAAVKAQPPDFTSHAMPHAKYCVMRTGWEKTDRYLLFDCAPWGGGHSHQDRLQVILYAGRDLLIDPGIYSYDQPLSGGYFRRSEAHNVLVVDGQEQPQSEPGLLSWSVSDVADFTAGEIKGDGGLTHRRSVFFLKPDYFVVVDHVLGEEQHEVTRLFHFPLVEVSADETSARTRYPEGANVWVKNADDARLEMREGWVPTGSATAEKAPVAALVGRVNLPVALAAVLMPLEGNQAPPRVERLPSADPMVVGLRMTFEDGQEDQVVVGPEAGELRVGGRTARARAVCVRSGPRASAVCLVDGSELREQEAGQ